MRYFSGVCSPGLTLETHSRTVYIRYFISHALLGIARCPYQKGLLVGGQDRRMGTWLDGLAISRSDTGFGRRVLK